MTVTKTAMRGLVATLLAGASLSLPACQRSPAVVDTSGFGEGVVRLGDTEVARVDGTPIYLSDVERSAASQGLIAEGIPLSTTDPVFRTTLEELIDQRLLALDALRQGLDQQDEARRRLLSARERILGNLRVETTLAEEVNERTIRELYEAQRDLADRGEERRARQIVVADQETARSLVQRLEDEEDFETLVAEYSIDTATSDIGGELGWVSRDMLPGALRRAIFDTAVGSRAAPVSTQEGWHVIEVLERRTPRARTFEETREEIARFMTFDAIQTLVTDLRDGADIQLNFGAAALPDRAGPDETEAGLESEADDVTEALAEESEAP